MKNIMTQAELEGYFDVSTNTVNEWRKSGLPIVKIKGKNFYMAESVMTFFKQQEAYEYQR